jgi:hypothetical protein
MSSQVSARGDEMPNLEGMNRAESKLYRMQETVLGSKKWAKMLSKVDFSKEVQPYKLVPIGLNGHLKQYSAWAMPDRIEFSKDYAKRATPKALTHTMKHEMAHVLLLQNDISDGHSPLYKTVCHCLGLTSPASKEGSYNYKHKCPQCGWWLKDMKKRVKVGHTCRGKFVFLVSKAEYQRLKRIEAIGSETIPVTLGAYQVMEIQKIDPNLKLKAEEKGKQ